ncbi:oocyte zinc finger protein XlCOF6-like isoform X2 [Sitophilus oryzae]|uniref:Oocyte zinc finger protein XlCOF6-like isoform X2 n=1 Tax=Sitophilus oryzae TaxID=7048 RepID=A0A6J2XN41_SITOR|nr:oocyte zinc finger protein XlCOF6-like isoform X2 [Sitophilus oryzae]
MDNIDEGVDLNPPTDTAFNNKSISVEHIKQENNISEENINGSSDNKFELSKEVKKKVYRCTLCRFQTVHRTSLYQHQKIHLATEERQLFACAHCNKKYKNKDNLKLHLEEYHNDSRMQEYQKAIYRCATCDYQTTHNSQLNQHKKIHLTLEERQVFACEHCDKKYTRKSKLQDHLKYNHIDSRQKESWKKVKCSKCDYQTFRMSLLRRHEAVHLAPEERQLFTCAHCDKKYRKKVNLKYHIEDKHIGSRSSRMKISQKKVYGCAVCGFQTLYRSSLIQHEAVHVAPEERELFGCSHCEKKYFTKDGLEYHLKDNHIDSRMKESQKKVYRCSTCSYQTPSMSNHRQHEKVHLAPEDRQLFACTQCDKKYTSKRNLQHHLKRDHVDSRNADCTSPTDEVILDSLKMEIDDYTPHLDDFKNAERVAVTNKVKSEDFLKIEINDYDTLILNKEMQDNFRNTDNLSITKKLCIKLEDFIKLEPEDDK